MSNPEKLQNPLRLPLAKDPNFLAYTELEKNPDWKLHFHNQWVMFQDGKQIGSADSETELRTKLKVSLLTGSIFYHFVSDVPEEPIDLPSFNVV